MKLIRKPAPITVPEPPAEPKAPAAEKPSTLPFEVLATVAMATNEMVASVSETSKAIASKLEDMVQPAPVERAQSFRCRVTSRDYLGRIEAFEIQAIPPKGH